MIWKIKGWVWWLREYITLTPKKYDDAISKLEGLLCCATGNQYSKATYSLECMERMVADYIEECCQEAVREASVENAE